MADKHIEEEWQKGGWEGERRKSYGEGEMEQGRSGGKREGISSL